MEPGALDVGLMQEHPARGSPTVRGQPLTILLGAGRGPAANAGKPAHRPAAKGLLCDVAKRDHEQADDRDCQPPRCAHVVQTLPGWTTLILQ